MHRVELRMRSKNALKIVAPTQFPPLYQPIKDKLLEKSILIMIFDNEIQRQNTKYDEYIIKKIKLMKNGDKNYSVTPLVMLQARII